MEPWLEREIYQWVHHEGSIRQPTTELCLTPISETRPLTDTARLMHRPHNVLSVHTN